MVAVVVPNDHQFIQLNHNKDELMKKINAFGKARDQNHDRDSLVSGRQSAARYVHAIEILVYGSVIVIFDSNESEQVERI